MLGLPALLGLVWWTGDVRGPETTAEVSIDTPNVAELREVVISRLTAVGAVKTAETTTYTDGGDSELVFRIPPGRLEQALDELSQVGGTVTEQQVELDELAESGNGFSSGLADVAGCLNDLGTQLDASELTSAATDIASCKEQVTEVSKRLTTSPTQTTDALLSVHVHVQSTTSWALIAAVSMLALGLAVMAFLTFRSAQIDGMIDLSDPPNDRADDELYLRRN